MAKRHAKICTVCGKHYQYCNSCAQYAHLPLWMSAFCSEKCMNIFDVSGRYNIGEYSKEEAKEILDKLGVSKDDVFVSAGVTKSMNEIYSADGSRAEDFKVEAPKEVKENKETVEENKAEEVVKKTTDSGKSSKEIEAEKNKVSEYVNATKKRGYRKNKE